MSLLTASSGFDMTPGAQVPITTTGGQTAATAALASAAYRDGPVEGLVAANPATGRKPPKLSIFEPNFGEAFARAVEVRMLGGARKETVQSFGTDPQTVVEHCLAANRLRQRRDAQLTAVMLVFGLLFLPGTLIWLGAFQLRQSLAERDGRASLASQMILPIVGIGAAVLLFRPPVQGVLGVYARVVLLVPVIGWFIARRICENAATDLRARWDGLLSGSGLGAVIPEAVPRHPDDERAERLRQSLVALTAEQNSNVVFYAGPKGILGMGTRWGSWQLAEELVPRDGPEIHPFRSWDVIRAIQTKLADLERGPLHTGGFPKPSIRHWVVQPVGEGADEIKRPTGPEVEAYSVKEFEIQRICNEQQFGSGNRHYLGVQFVLWDGQLVITLLITVTVLHSTLRIEVTGHALGPVHSLFTTKPAAKEKEVAKSVRFWETKKVRLPLVEPAEVVRLAARAPLTWYPPLLDFVGGKITLPEPFGLRHTWAQKPWRHRFMADDALRAATPVLRAVHAAALSVLEQNGVDTERFTTRSLLLSNLVQGVEPRQADVYEA